MTVRVGIDTGRGRLIPRRAWVFDGGDGEFRSCAPDCEELYETYWRSTYGVMSVR
jgi:hypothetical protein